MPPLSTCLGGGTLTAADRAEVLAAALRTLKN